MSTTSILLPPLTIPPPLAPLSFFYSRCRKFLLECDNPREGKTKKHKNPHLHVTINGALHNGRPVDLKLVEKKLAGSTTIASGGGGDGGGSSGGGGGSTALTTKPKINHSKLKRFLRVMEKINECRRRNRFKKEVVDKIIDALTKSLLDVRIGSSGSSGHYADDYSITTPCTSSGDSSHNTTPNHHHHYHGNPTTAIHPSLIELYYPPFASFAFVAIEGEESCYCNRLFETMFLITEEVSRRLREECQAPRDIIAR